MRRRRCGLSRSKSSGFVAPKPLVAQGLQHQVLSNQAGSGPIPRFSNRLTAAAQHQILPRQPLGAFSSQSTNAGTLLYASKLETTSAKTSSQFSGLRCRPSQLQQPQHVVVAAHSNSQSRLQSLSPAHAKAATAAVATPSPPVPQLTPEQKELVKYGKSLPHLACLNAHQLQVVCAQPAPICVLAGPGAGKTRVIVHRIVHLVHSFDTLPSSILALTFTNKAATEMKTRVEHMLTTHGLGGGAQADQSSSSASVSCFNLLSPWMGTFHAFCAFLLRKYGGEIGIKRAYTIMDMSDQRTMLRRLIKECTQAHQQSNVSSGRGSSPLHTDELLTQSSYASHTSPPGSQLRIIKPDDMARIISRAKASLMRAKDFTISNLLAAEEASQHEAKQLGKFNKDTSVSTDKSATSTACSSADQGVHNTGGVIYLSDSDSDSHSDSDIGVLESDPSAGISCSLEHVKDSSEESIMRQVYSKYEAELKTKHILDFDELLVAGRELLELFPRIADATVRQYQHILVDEFQDTSKLQYDIVRMLGQAQQRVNNSQSQALNSCSVMIVGDPDQSIYSWRQASHHNWTRFQNDFSPVQRILLEQNYRSTNYILQSAATVMDNSNDANRVKKHLWTSNMGGSLTELVHCISEQQQASYILEKLAAVSKERHDEKDSKPFSLDDVAILCRTSKMSKQIEEHLLANRLVNYRVVGGLRLDQNRETKDLLSYLRFCINASDDVSFSHIIRIPSRGIGDKSIASLIEYSKQNQKTLLQACSHVCKKSGPATKRSRELGKFVKLIRELNHRATQTQTRVLDMLKHIIRSIQYHSYLRAKVGNMFDDKWSHVKTLLHLAKEVDERFDADEKQESMQVADGREPLSRVVRFLEECTLDSSTATSPTDESKTCANEPEVPRSWSSSPAQYNGTLTISTIHSAKGLEWDIVFIPSVMRGVFPHNRSKTDEQIEEERRLLFVAMTRACKQLYLLYDSYREFDPEQLLVSEHQLACDHGQLLDHNHRLSVFLQPLVGGAAIKCVSAVRKHLHTSSHKNSRQAWFASSGAQRTQQCTPLIEDEYADASCFSYSSNREDISTVGGSAEQMFTQSRSRGLKRAASHPQVRPWNRQAGSRDLSVNQRNSVPHSNPGILSAASFLKTIKSTDAVSEEKNVESPQHRQSHSSQLPQQPQQTHTPHSHDAGMGVGVHEFDPCAFDVHVSDSSAAITSVGSMSFAQGHERVSNSSTTKRRKTSSKRKIVPKRSADQPSIRQFFG
jgi:superfamily I DNA/RNA helicase